jgi:hypothetical protein
VTGLDLISLFLLLKGLGSSSGSSSSSSTPTPPPPPPPQVPDAGGDDKLLKAGVGAAGSLVGLLGTLGGGSGAAGAGGGGAATSVTLAGAGGSGIAGGTGSSEVAGVGGAFAASITAGEVFGTAWLAFFILQFVIINLLHDARVQWIRYRDHVMDLNTPLHHLQRMEELLVGGTLQVLHLNGTFSRCRRLGACEQPAGPGHWPRLRPAARHHDHERGQPGDVPLPPPHLRQPIPLSRRGSAARTRTPLCSGASCRWGARLVASRYVVELAKFAQGMLTSFPGLGGHAVTEMIGATYNDVWNYPLLGGGQPDTTYAGFYAELQKLGVPIDDVLNAARLAALFKVAAATQMDPGIYFPWNPELYALSLYNALGLADPKHHITLQSDRWVIDPVFYKMTGISQLWLNIDQLKAGWHLAPFIDANASPPVCNPANAGVTCLVAIP